MWKALKEGSARAQPRVFWRLGAPEQTVAAGGAGGVGGAGQAGHGCEASGAGGAGGAAPAQSQIHNRNSAAVSDANDRQCVIKSHICFIYVLV